MMRGLRVGTAALLTGLVVAVCGSSGGSAGPSATPSASPSVPPSGSARVGTAVALRAHKEGLAPDFDPANAEAPVRGHMWQPHYAEYRRG